MVEQLAQEYWGWIPNHPHYLVSNVGRVFSIRRNRIMNCSTRDKRPRQQGRARVKLSNHQKRYEGSVARLMLLAFRPVENSDQLEAAHNDGNPRNNVLSNLRWTDKKGNAADRVVHGTEMYGEKNPAAKLNHAMVRIIKRLLSNGGLTQVQIGEIFGVKQAIIWKIKVGRNWKQYE